MFVRVVFNLLMYALEGSVLVEFKKIQRVSLEFLFNKNIAIILVRQYLLQLFKLTDC